MLYKKIFHSFGGGSIRTWVIGENEGVNDETLLRYMLLKDCAEKSIGSSKSRFNKISPTNHIKMEKSMCIRYY